MTDPVPENPPPVDLPATIRRQQQAAHPLTSAWVSANAGSGKTVDRRAERIASARANGNQAYP